MISELHFVRSYSSFWHDIMPFCDFLIRDINDHLSRQFITSPLDTNTEPSRRALVNELAFLLFEQVPETISGERFSELLHIAWIGANKFTKKDISAFPLPTHEEITEARRLAQRLRLYFLQYHHKPLLRPRFAGCGFIDECEGDLIYDDTLYEVKSGDRAFLGSDIRQLILYSALNFQSSQYCIRYLGLLNPRHGMKFVMDLNEICIRIGAVEAPELLGRVVAFISGGGVSR